MSKTEQLTYNGVEFVIDKSFWFEVPSLEKRWQSYYEMTEGIDKSRKAVAAIEREKLSLKCVDSNGVSRTVNGVHAGNGSLLLTPKDKAYARSTIYPDLKWVREALKARMDAANHIAKMDDILHRMVIEPHKGYGFDVADHPNCVARVKEQYANVERITSDYTFGDLLAKSTAKQIEL